MSVLEAPVVPVSDAARRLDVSEQRVRAMITAGQLDAEKVAGVWLIPASSLARVAVAGRGGGRPFSPAGAWALLTIASGEPPEWVAPRVRRRAGAVLDREGLAATFCRLGRRATRHAWQAHPAEVARLAGDGEVMLGGVGAASAHRFGLQGGEELEAYVRAGAVTRLVKRHGLIGAADGNVVLRAVPDKLWAILHRPIAPPAAVLADLAEHPDARARRVARERAGLLDRERARGG